MKTSFGRLFAQTHMFSDLSPGISVLLGGPDSACPIVHILDDLFDLDGMFRITRRLRIPSPRELLKIAG